MSKEDIKQVAKDVLETIGKDELLNMGKILRKNGYSVTTSENPQQVTNSKTYQEEMKPVIDRLTKERDRILTEMEGKDLSAERYKDLVDGMDKITKNSQLLSGGATENSAVIIKGFNFVRPEE